MKIKVGQNQIAFELNGAILVSKLIEGNYPNYRQVIPAETKERVTLERESFHNAVRRVAILTSEKSNSIKLVLTKNNLDIVANSPEIGEAKETIAVKYGGKEFTIAFNPDLLMAPLRNLVDDEIYLDLIDEMSPGLIQHQGAVPLCVDADAHQLLSVAADFFAGSMASRTPANDARSLKT